MKITRNELYVMDAIDAALITYTGGTGLEANYPIHSCWVSECCKLSGKKLSGTMSSLAKKGFIECYHDGDSDTVKVTLVGEKAWSNRFSLSDYP